MRNRSILLAIGIAAAAVVAGYSVEVPLAFTRGTAPAVVSELKHKARVQRTRLAGIVREVTAYNVGVSEQTSDDPCVGASGRDLCRLVRQGVNVCAANFVALGTVLRIGDYGECVVLDRMHPRFPHRVDIAMNEDEIDEAREFGVQQRVVEVKE